MIIDVTGIELIPGNQGKDCPGNGEHIGEDGNDIECCCDECDYMLCCLDDSLVGCENCTDNDCPRAEKKTDPLFADLPTTSLSPFAAAKRRGRG